MHIQVNTPHGHPSGWAPNEIGPFIDSHCIGGKPLPVPGQPIIEGEKSAPHFHRRHGSEIRYAPLHHG